MRTLITRASLLTIAVTILLSCNDEYTPNNRVPELTVKVNNFIKSTMHEYYLWYKNMPLIDPNYKFNSEDYFYELLYEEDKWSYITSDIKAFEESINNGIEKTFGYMLAFGNFSNTGTVFAIVEYVYPNSPAYKAGLKRGDIIVLMNDSDITVGNYSQLLYNDNISITLGVLSEAGLSTGNTISMTSEVLMLDPVQIWKVINYDGHKIGYLFYTQYISDFNSSLDKAFLDFQQQGITDLIVDLRYNPGGGILAAQYFCSSIAPFDIVNNGNTLVTFQWNDKIQNVFKQNPDQYAYNLEVTFTDNVTAKLGLNKIYFLTGSGTASASELSITGLKPYMDVTLVGDTTFGKYTGSITIKPEDFYHNDSYYSDFKNWGLQPIVLRYANSMGFTDFKNGFAPDIPVYDDLLTGIALGDVEESLLKAAVEDITGTKVPTTRSVKKENPKFNVFDRGFSKYDKNKREVILDLYENNFIPHITE
ncbi:MAG: hypothetical protein LBV47_06985 [Bacteroidales bacterium]|jgi:C-terminal processing protease CtpA/Prc|nr:hypothetical protein [Bacteroidales bacterium]